MPIPPCLDDGIAQNWAPVRTPQDDPLVVYRGDTAPVTTFNSGLYAAHDACSQDRAAALDLAKAREALRACGKVTHGADRPHREMAKP